jgi:surface polysaccharide O-acyltransferase-like enzyme
MIDLPKYDRTTYLSYGDILRIFGATAVALIHMCEPFVKDPASISPGNWWFCNFMVSWSRSAVPLFLMLSGALLLHPAKIEPIKVFYRKRIQRIGIPLVFWSALYMAYEAKYGIAGLTIHEALKRTAQGLTYGHLYFLFAIAGLYLFTPVMWIYIQRATRRELLFGITLVFIMLAGGNLAASFAQYWLGGTAFTKFVPYLGYYPVGYYLRDTALTKKAFVLTCLLCITSIALTMLGTFCLIFQLDIGRHLLLSKALSPTIIITSITLFLIIGNLVRWLERGKTRKRNVVSKLASLTMGVYLIHLWFVERLHAGFADRILAWIAEHTHIVIAQGWHDRVWLCVPLATLVILGISYTISFIIGRIPYVRRIIGL